MKRSLPKYLKEYYTKMDVSNLSSEERLQALILYTAFKQSNDAMFHTDRHGIILDINDAFTRIYGYTRQEAIGRTPSILRSRHSTREMYQRMWSAIQTGGFWRGQIINRAKDGREISVTLTITTLRDAEGQIAGYVSNAMDVTEQIALHTRVAHAEALAHLGEMAATVAHEIRNPLSSIVMAAKQLTDAELSKEERDLVLRVLKEESQRLTKTLSSFLAYARPKDLKLVRGDLNQVVGDVCRMIQSNKDMLKDIRLKKSLDSTIEPFPMDADQLRQVAWNMVLNAIQAMEGKGRLSVKTGRAFGSVFFQVGDTGPGISESSRADIFKPFFTTKGQGTGLGLAIAERIVKAHGGLIEVESREGHGATFTVHLPSIDNR